MARNEKSRFPSFPQEPEVDAPPAYDFPQQVAVEQPAVRDDGRVEVNLDSRFSQVFSKFMGVLPEPSEEIEPLPIYTSHEAWSPPLHIVLQVVGSRGDVQPFIALGTELQRYGHRVRLATHNVFQNFVESSGLEFYPIGGDPEKLMAYMVRNPGLIPSMKKFSTSEIMENRRMVREMLEGCWKSCISPDVTTGKPFVANAIIANPPSFAHIHCAQALGVPLHMVFTMPWSPTRAFPHPLANIINTKKDRSTANYLSYGLVQALTWQGLGDVINDWRLTIDLEPVPITEGPFLAETLKVPYTYCWSPALVPRPSDWPSHIDVCGFIFRDPPNYTPPPELDAFLRAGPPPIYIGFGSIVIKDPVAMTTTLLEAVKAAGVRAIISRGWSKLGGTDEPPENVHYLGDCPHEWLFQHVAAVIHHGGAGTTAAGLQNGRPTLIVPFFGDQPFWGDMVAHAGAGPSPIHHKLLNSQNLTEAIQFCLAPQTLEAAAVIAEKMNAESGVRAAAASFHRNLSSTKLACDLVPRFPAAWVYSKSKKKMKLSGHAAHILVQEGRLKPKDLSLYMPNVIHIENRRWDPITSGASAAIGVSTDILTAAQGIWKSPHAIRKKAELEDPGEGSSKHIPAMIGASAKSIPKLSGTVLKGFMVDTTYAITEGMRNSRKLYGGEVDEMAPITDWKSGAIAAGKNMRGLPEGLFALFTEPAKGLMNDGIVGFGKGVGRGAMDTVTKSSSAMLGLVAYPAQGIYKSIHTATHAGTRKSIEIARKVHDGYMVRNMMRAEQGDVKEVVDAFELKRNNGWVPPNGL